MSHRVRAGRTVARSLSRRIFALAIVALALWPSRQLAAQAPEIQLTQIGSPIWRPVDSALISAPIEPDAAFNATVGAILGATYTNHLPPYDHELSANLAAAGLVSRSVFSPEAISGQPDGLFFSLLILPDPGMTGGSRDFASGPIIPNSLFPFQSRTEVWRDGAFFSLIPEGSEPMQVRPEDAPFEGTSHRIRVGNRWFRLTNPYADFEIRWSLIDAQNNGWEIVFPFKVVHPGDFDEDGDVDADDLPRWTANFGKTSGALHVDGDADFDGDVDGDDFLRWQRQLGQGSALAASAAVPEPSTSVILGIAAIGIGAARASSRRLRNAPFLPPDP